MDWSTANPIKKGTSANDNGAALLFLLPDLNNFNEYWCLKCIFARLLIPEKPFIQVHFQCILGKHCCQLMCKPQEISVTSEEVHHPKVGCWWSSLEMLFTALLNAPIIFSDWVRCSNLFGTQQLFLCSVIYSLWVDAGASAGISAEQQF